MSVKVLALLIAALSGVTMALQGSLNAALGKIIGLLETTFVVNLVGLAVVSSLLFVFRPGDGDWHRYAEAPWYLYLGGILGVLITYGVVRSIPSLGVAVATTAIIVGQVLTAAMVDHLGLFGLERVPFSWHRVAGTALMASGAWLLLKK
ncbi:DMT family transporter [Desulfallas sp. Bu1-1]|uniref:DMT family transporter n=1 Tax=Desulfallas sp. Bu1-1 TaxID=2787620 RepID=UPI00189EB587|nr:DMT family transporter [Desulfallas sp. Bu1-1]MBF7082671.1 DMT family transporter [Desulfallas sp. Bu1-1]